MSRLAPCFTWGCFLLQHCSCYFFCDFRETPPRDREKNHLLVAEMCEQKHNFWLQNKQLFSTPSSQDERYALLGRRLWFLLSCFSWVPQGFDSAAAHSGAPRAGISLLLCWPPGSAAALPGGPLCADPAGSLQQHAVNIMDRPQGAGQRTVWICNGVNKKRQMRRRRMSQEICSRTSDR